MSSLFLTLSPKAPSGISEKLRVVRYWPVDVCSFTEVAADVENENIKLAASNVAVIF